MTKKRVFITGATGNMGGAAFKELLLRSDRFDVVLLARPSKKNIRELAQYKDNPAVNVIWGDLTDYDSVLKGVTGADYVLHIGGMVSPAADMYPERTLKVNVTGAQNVIKAIKATTGPGQYRSRIHRLCSPGGQPSAATSLGTLRGSHIYKCLRLVLGLQMPCRAGFCRIWP